MNIAQSFTIAVQHRQAGRLTESEALCRQILAVQADHAGALHLLGAIAHQNGHHDQAVEWIQKAILLDPLSAVAYSDLGAALRAMGAPEKAILACRRAIELRPDAPEAHKNLAHALKAIGRVDEAILAFRRVLELNPSDATVHFQLGNSLKDRRQFDEAIVAYQRALEIQPSYAPVLHNLGAVLAEIGKFEAAIAAYRQVLAHQPQWPQTWFNLGNALRDQGQIPEAIAAYRQALEIKDELPDVHHNLGVVLAAQGQLDEAIAAYGRALEIRPDHAETLNNLGAALAGQGRLEDALSQYSRAVQLEPNYAAAHNNLGSALRDQGRPHEAIAAYQRALRLDPNYASACGNLGTTLAGQGQFDAAMAAFHRALELKPDSLETRNNLASALFEQCRLDEAIALYRQVLRVEPQRSVVHSNLIYALHFHPDIDHDEIREEQRRWNRQVSDPVQDAVLPCDNDRDPVRPLRIGYVSPHFRDHVIGRNLVPLFKHHDRLNYEIVCYSGALRGDHLTEQFRAASLHWRSTVGISDADLAATIRRDKVDILVDLTQHLEGDRLPVFARRPAPVQVSFAGYPEGTGLDAIGDRVSDRRLESEIEVGRSEIGRTRESEPRTPISHLEPALSLSKGAAEQVFLLDSFWCYDPCGTEVSINELPAIASGRLTFGSLNNFSKINEPVLKLWARILASVEGSQMILLSGIGSHRQRTLEILEREGIDVRRVQFVEPRPRHAYLELHHHLDIVLDPFPYNGHTTSLDALWMGVPVVSLAGKSSVSRAGLSILTNLGLPELVAETDDEYVRIAAGVAGNLARLAELRATLRSRMEASVLMDAPRFARQIETAYREMWRRWCAGEPGEKPLTTSL